MKRCIALLLALATLAPLVSGCAVVTRGSDYCYKFLEHIVAYEFDEAFDMIAEATKIPDSVLSRAEKRALRQAEKEAANGTPSPEPTTAPLPTDEAGELRNDVMKDGSIVGSPGDMLPLENGATPDPALAGPVGTPIPETPTPSPEPTPAPKATKTPKPTPTPTPSPTPALDANGNPVPNKTISRKDFVSKYESVFEELQLTGIEYSQTDVTDGEIIAYVDYTLTYHSERGGELTYDFRITANRVEHRWCIDWSPALIFPMMDWGDNVRVGILQANRGEILCDGEAYAQNVSTITVFAVPSTIISYAQEEAKKIGKTEAEYPTTEEIYAEFARKVAAISEMETTEEKVVEALNKQRNDFAKLQTFFPDEMSLGLEETLLAIKGLSIDTANYGTLRYYPFGTSLCHIVGYAGIVTKEEMKEFEKTGDTRYNGDSWLGKYGLEQVYEETLLGTNGRFTYIQDSTGGSKGMLYKDDAVDGKDLHLTINPELQERLEDVIDITVYDTSIFGAVVVLNPKTGALLAATSWPGFDLNYLARGMPEDEWEALKNKVPEIPLYNRCTQGLYTPGSVFKTMTSAALLETNTLSATDVFPGNEAQYIDGDEWMPSEGFMATLSERADAAMTFAEQAHDRPLRRTGNSHRHTPMNMLSSIVDSDNLYFAYGALRLGWTKFEKYMERIGWGEPIYFEGLEVSTPQLYDKTKKQYDYDLAVTGYGQGQILVSPLQLACYVSAYANDGNIMTPYVVDSIWHASGTDYTLIEQRQPKIWKRAFQQSTVDTLLPQLRLVCTEGTARSMNISFISKRQLTVGYTLAGKTGTAEITDDKSKELAWFVCWRDKNPDGTPVTEENARLVCVMLELNLVDGKIPSGTEIAQMKYDIARAILKEDDLN